VSKELVERLRVGAEIYGCYDVMAQQMLTEAADAIERLTYDSIHTCHDDCPRLPCVQRREIDALRAEVAELESWKVAEDAHHHLLLAEVRRLTNELQAHKAMTRRSIR
jgi:hypothetical protein